MLAQCDCRTPLRCHNSATEVRKQLSTRKMAMLDWKPTNWSLPLLTYAEYLWVRLKKNCHQFQFLVDYDNILLANIIADIWGHCDVARAKSLGVSKARGQTARHPQFKRHNLWPKCPKKPQNYTELILGKSKTGIYLQLTSVKKQKKKYYFHL